MLKVEKVNKRFGALVALKDCTINVDRSEIVGLIGPNGAGKSTLVNIISGELEADSGKITYKEQNIRGLPPDKIARKGIGRTYQTAKVFRWMSVINNMIAAGSTLPLKLNDLNARAEANLKLFELHSLRNEFAANLSVGQQKLLDFAMRMMLEPELLILDEPFHGVHYSLKNKILERVDSLNREQEKTFLMISHDLPSVTSICKRLVVLDAGEIISEGSPQEVVKDKSVIECYIGA